MVVVVVGGGYGGVRVAKALDDHVRVVLVEPKDAFHHNVAALRGLVDPSLLSRTYLPYDRLLVHGSVRRDRVVEASAHRVLLASGETLSPDILVLATGSTYPFPAKSALRDQADSLAEYRRLHDNLADAPCVILLGAGAVGVELAGEITAAWPTKHVVLVDPADDVLPGAYDPELRSELRRQLDERGVELLLGHPLREAPATRPGDLAPVTIETTAGARRTGELWLRCHGITPVTDYLGVDLASARTSDGYLEVDSTLRLKGHDRVYALGDIVAAEENKAGVARRQAEVVVANILGTLDGSGRSTEYASGPPLLILPLGPNGGVGQVPGRGLLSPEAVAQVKGNDMFLNQYEEFFGVSPSSVD